ncbi:hypothetical protein ACFLYW_00830 [Thermodesulfobacteriota bacterium]
MYLINKNKIKSIIRDNSDDIAFIIGNGINYHFNKQNSSWEDLLLFLWSKHTFETKSFIPPGISFTEFYDALEIQNYSKNNFSGELQKDVKDRMANWIANKEQNIILNEIKSLNSPVLTTNFDDQIPRSLNLDFHKMTDTKFTDYYPWSCYYSSHPQQFPEDGFGVWFLNGMIKYHRSIKLGLSQYMGNVERARKLIHEKPENISFEGKNRNFWSGHKTWLHILFNKSLFIFGLGLDENEIFLRWLLIERAKYFRKFTDRKHKGWYLMKTDEQAKNNIGKKFFLESVGIEVLEVKDYNTIYEDIWI